MATYTPRLDSSGMSDNPFWYSATNPFYNAGYWLPYPTTYAWGRFWEISGSEHVPSLSYSIYPDDWFSEVDGYERGYEPKLGAVLCLSEGPYGVGHVAIVEQINDDGSIVTSNSDYTDYFYTETRTPLDNYSTGGYVFQGFIYNPYAGDSPQPIKRFKWWLFEHMARRKKYAYRNTKTSYSIRN